jgi:hypothetical protein
VHIGMANKFALGSFNFICTKKSFFIFLMLKMGFFCEAPTKNMFKKWTTTILNDIIPYFMHNLPFFAWKKFSMHPSRN